MISTLFKRSIPNGLRSRPSAYRICTFILLVTVFGTFSSDAASFEECKGQLQSRSVTFSSKTLFLARIASGTLVFRPGGFSVVFHRADSTERIDFDFDATVVGPVPLSPLPSHLRYYSSDSPSELVARYAEIAYTDPKTGRSWSFRLDGDTLRCSNRFIPGDIGNQRRSVSGVRSVWRTEGIVTMFGHLGSITEFASANALASPVHRAATMMAATTSDGQETLVTEREKGQSAVTTLMTFSGYFGGNGADSVCSVAQTADGIVVCGWTQSTVFPTTSGVSQTSNAGNRDAFVTRFSADGTVVWSTFLGGSDDDAMFGVCTVGSTMVIAGGLTNSKTGLATPGVAFGSYTGGSSDGFVASFDYSTGKRVACSYIGSPKKDTVFSVCSNGSDVFIGGSTDSESGWKMTTHQKDFGGATDGFLLSINPALSTVGWSSYYGSVGFERILAMDVSGGDLSITGETSSPTIDEAIASNCVEGQERRFPPDVFIAQFATTGTRRWGRYFGGSNVDSPTGIKVMQGGKIVLCGYTLSPNSSELLIATSDTPQSSLSGNSSDGFVAVFRGDGTRVWGSYQGGTADDRCLAVTVAPTGYVTVCGTTGSADFPLTASDQSKLSGGSDAFVAHFSPEGTIRTVSAIFGGSAGDAAVGLAWLSPSTLMICGSTTSSDFPTKNPGQSQNAGASDLFLTRMENFPIVDVEESDEPELFLCTPNPATSMVRIPCCDSKTSSELLIYSVSGDLMMKCMIPATGQMPSSSIDVSELPSGMYTLVLTAGKAHRSTSFIKR